MSVRRQTSTPDADDLAEVPFIDETERAESAWLLARQEDPGAAAPSPPIASDYAELEDLLHTLPTGAPDHSWHDDVLRAASPAALPSRPWWRRKPGWTGVAALAAVAAVVVLVRPSRAPAELEVAIRHVSGARADSEVVVGDRIVVSARPGTGADLRIFRSDGTPVARCPGGAGCRIPAPGEYILEATLDAPVRYHVVLVTGMSRALPLSTMDTFIDAARAADAHIVMDPPIDVH